VFELLIVANAVGRQRRLERFQAEVGELRRDRERGVEIVTRIGIAPMKSAWRKRRHHTNELEIVDGRLGMTDFNIEVGVAPRTRQCELLLGAVESRCIHRPTEFDLAFLRTAQKFADRAARLLAP
jgi:hypothetical protein